MSPLGCHTADRSLSDVQECAQFLAGEALPCGLLSALLGRTEVPKQTDTCVLINLTAYDSWVERACKRFSDQTTIPIKFKTLSMSKTISTAEYVEKTLACELLEDSQLSSQGKGFVIINLFSSPSCIVTRSKQQTGQHPSHVCLLEIPPGPITSPIPPGVEARQSQAPWAGACIRAQATGIVSHGCGPKPISFEADQA